jgi:predicted dithiol-disulfide oxidoreductase (DUF899 family)
VFGWPEHACRGCSLGADQVGHLAHLNTRDTSLAYVSRAPQADIARLNAYSDDVGRAFRLMSATCSDRSRPAVPIDVGRGGGAPAGRM